MVSSIHASGMSIANRPADERGVVGGDELGGRRVMLIDRTIQISSRRREEKQEFATTDFHRLRGS